MKRVIIITDHYFDDRRGGGISSAVSNLFLHLDGEVNISIISFRKEDGKIRPIFFYHALLNFLFFNKNVVFYLTGIFNFHKKLHIQTSDNLTYICNRMFFVYQEEKDIHGHKIIKKELFEGSQKRFIYYVPEVQK